MINPDAVLVCGRCFYCGNDIEKGFYVVPWCDDCMAIYWREREAGRDGCALLQEKRQQRQCQRPA